jgi:hypothetical protein
VLTLILTLQRKRCSHCISKFRIAQTCTNYVYTATEETERGIHRARQRERTFTHPPSRDENRWQCQNACADNQIENIAASSQCPQPPSPSSQCTLLSTKPSMVISFCSFLLNHILCPKTPQLDSSSELQLPKFTQNLPNTKKSLSFLLVPQTNKP